MRFDDDDGLAATPADLALGAPELAELAGEVARVAAERPWTNFRGWMGKVVARAAVSAAKPRL